MPMVEKSISNTVNKPITQSLNWYEQVSFLPARTAMSVGTRAVLQSRRLHLLTDYFTGTEAF